METEETHLGISIGTPNRVGGAVDRKIGGPNELRPRGEPRVDLASRGQSSTEMSRLEPATKRSYQLGVPGTKFSRIAPRVNTGRAEDRDDFAVPRDTGGWQTSGYARWLQRTKSSEEAARFRILRCTESPLRGGDTSGL